MTVEPALDGQNLDERMIYAVESGLWTEGRAVVLDAGTFPRSRVADVAALASHIRVVGDRGIADALREAGVADVSVSEGRTIADAVRVTADARAPIIFCGEPRKAEKAVTSALSAITDRSGPQLPVAAVMVMRAQPPADGPLCPLAERSFVSGYGVLFSMMLAGKTGRNVRAVTPQTDRLKATHSAVVNTAMDLARQSGTRIDVISDPAPRTWAIENSDRLGGIFCGVLEARGDSKSGGGKIARKAGAEFETAVALIEKASCDVVVVLDRVSLMHGASAGAHVAKVIGAAMVATVAVGGVAAPAAAATPTVAHQVTKAPQAGVGRRAQSNADTQGPAAATQTTGQTAVDTGTATGDTAQTDQTAVDTGTDQVPTPISKKTQKTGSVTEDGGSGNGEKTIGDGQEAIGSGEEAIVDGDQLDPAAGPQSDIETPIEWISFRVWTDSHGEDHVISSGLQDHWVPEPALPDWAVQDGGDHPWLAKPDPGPVSPKTTTTKTTTAKPDGDHSATQNRQASHQHRTGKHKAGHKDKVGKGHKANKKHKAGKNKSAKHKAGNKGKAGKHKTAKKHRLHRKGSQGKN